MPKSHPFLRVSLWLILLGLSAGSLVFTGTLLYLGPKLPQVEQILDIQLQTPLRIYSSEEKLIAEFGEKKRTPISYPEIPTEFVHAFLAAEDSRFFSHPGVDIKGLTRAALELISTGSIQSGGSTITMQVARNYFLTLDQTFLRKFNEILLSLDMERKLTKEQILELYINKIYLGHRAYGIQAAAQVYYGKPVDALSLAQVATIAGLPKAPSAFNPVTNPARALVRRNWILSRMHELEYISKEEMDKAIAEPSTAELHGIPVEVEAPYFAEMVRRDMLDRFGEKAVTEGYKVVTTLKAENQAAANNGLQHGLIAYDRRHGYRGEEAKIEFDSEETPSQESLLAELKRFRTIGPLEPAIVMEVTETGFSALIKSGEVVPVDFETMKWARRYLDNIDRGPEPKSADKVVAPGHVVRLVQENDGWSFAQKPIAQSALVSLDPSNGALLAIVGGFDFRSSKFNRAVQGGRQAGSSFKPFIYSAALEKGMTPATVINDAPVVFEDSSLESTWRPENSGGRFYGPTRLRQALYKSRNLVSIRVLRQIGIKSTIEYAEKFGFDPNKLPDNLSLALGSADLTPMEIASAYAILANGGYQVEPWYISRIEDREGNILFEADPLQICDKACEKERQLKLAEQEREAADEMDFKQLLQQEAEQAAQPETAPEEAKPEPRYAERVQDERINFLITNMMQDVIKRGTGVRARALDRSDIAGKTGTTNDQKDAWFSGFNKDVVATVWVGFDQPRNLGRGEYGGTAALPIWIDYMRTALKGSPQASSKIPDGVITLKIDPETGKRAKPGQVNAVFEYFLEENAPKQEAETSIANPHLEESNLPEQLF